MTSPPDLRLSPRQWGLLLLVALAVRLISNWALFGDLGFVSDALDYHQVALKMLAGPLAPAPYYWPPGTSYLLALAYALWGGWPMVARLLLVAIGLACVALCVLIAQKVLKDRAQVLAAGHIAAWYPPMVLMAGQPYASLPTALCLLLAAYFGLRFWQEERAQLLLWAGLALGAGCLVRPSMLAVVAAMALVALWRGWLSRGKGHGFAAPLLVRWALLVIPVVAVILPVMLINAAAGGGLVISTNNERNFFLGNNPHTPLYKTSHLPSRKLEDLPSETAAYLREHYGQNRQSLESRRRMTQAAMDYILGHPGETLWRTASRLRAFWGFDYRLARETAALNQWPGWAQGLLLLWEAGGYLVFMLLALAGFFLAPKEARRMGVLFALVLAYQAPYLLAFSSGTYHFPAIPLLFPLAGAGLVGMARAGLPGLRAALVRPLPVLVFCVFWAVQAEYAYHLLSHT